MREGEIACKSRQCSYMKFRLHRACCYLLDLGSQIFHSKNPVNVKKFKTGPISKHLQITINVNQKLKLDLEKVENIVGKGENAAYQIRTFSYGEDYSTKDRKHCGKRQS